MYQGMILKGEKLKLQKERKKERKKKNIVYRVASNERRLKKLISHF